MKLHLNGLLFLTLFSGAAYSNEWRELSPENTVLMTLPHGKVVIELAPQFAPKHVRQFSQLVNKQHYDGNLFYRVIDGFVAQAGPEKANRKNSRVGKLTLEGEWSTPPNWPLTQVQNNDLFAQTTGFKDGFAVAHQPNENKAWLTHCPGVIAMARSNHPNSASSHFYIVNGQAPRQLDRIMTIFGRVVYGMEHVQAIQRTTHIDGDTPVAKHDYTPIISMTMMSQRPKAEQILLAVENTDSNNFKAKLAKQRARSSSFYFKKPPPVLDICQIKVKTRKVTAAD